MMRQLTVSLLFVLFALASWLPAGGAADEGPKLDPTLPYQAKKSNPVTYDINYCVVVTPPYHAKTLKVWLPLPQSDAGQEVSTGELRTFPMKVAPKIGTEPRFGNKFAYFEFDQPEGAQLVRHIFKVKVWELDWNVEPGKVAAVQHWPASFDSYLRGDRTVVLSEQVKKLTGEIVSERTGPARELALVMGWVNDHIRYDHGNASLQASSEHALKNGCGHCSDYHGLCAALGRALGFPTRVTYGINPFPKNSPSHCKLEAYLPPYGWVSFDVSETQKLMSSIKKDKKLEESKKQALIQAARARLERGFRDNTWFLQTRGTDYDLAPPASKKVNVVRTIYAEADGVALPEPDPASPDKKEFAWMTLHRYTPDRTVPYPFKDWKTLLPDAKE